MIVVQMPNGNYYEPILSQLGLLLASLTFPICHYVNEHELSEIKKRVETRL